MCFGAVLRVCAPLYTHTHVFTHTHTYTRTLTNARKRAHICTHNTHNTRIHAHSRTYTHVQGLKRRSHSFSNFRYDAAELGVDDGDTDMTDADLAMPARASGALRAGVSGSPSASADQLPRFDESGSNARYAPGDQPKTVRWHAALMYFLFYLLQCGEFLRLRSGPGGGRPRRFVYARWHAAIAVAQGRL